MQREYLQLYLTQGCSKSELARNVYFTTYKTLRNWLVRKLPDLSNGDVNRKLTPGEITEVMNALGDPTKQVIKFPDYSK